MCGGASREQKELAKQQAAFADTLRESFKTRFAGQAEILNKLNKALTPVVSAGPGQRGLNPTEKRLAEARIADRTAANYQNAARAVGGQLAGRGGDSGLMSGVDAQIRAALASESAQQQSESQTQLELADFAAGRDQYNTALAGMGALSNQYSPEGFGTLGTQAGQSAFGMQKDIDAQKGQFWKTLAGGITGIVSNVIPGIGAIKSGISALSRGGATATRAAGQMSAPGYMPGDSYT